MPLITETLLILFSSFFIIATFYSSVGFGGGSSYLALLSLFAFSFFFIRSNALVCNLLVVSGSTYLFYRSGHFSIKDFFPFIIFSVPMAFIGALFKLNDKIFFTILGVALILSAISLLYQGFIKNIPIHKVYPKYLSYVLGAAIGLLSGLVGIGGGVFLAPILNHLRWGTPVKIAALSAFFILVNSASGLTGLIISDTIEFSWSASLVLIIAVFLGGQLGARISLNKGSPKTIRVGTAILVMIVGLRILISRGVF